MEESYILKTLCEKTASEITLSTYEDGAISLSRDGAEHFIYLYPDQINQLKMLLNKQVKL